MKTQVQDSPKNDMWNIILKVIIAVASALLGALGAQAIN